MFKIEFTKDSMEYGIEVSAYTVDYYSRPTIAYEDGGHIETKEFDTLFVDGVLRYSAEQQAKKEKEARDSMSIDHLGLSIRSRNCLYREGYRSLGDVLEIKDKATLSKIRNMGKRCMEEIVGKIREYDPDWLSEEVDDVID